MNKKWLAALITLIMLIVSLLMVAAIVEQYKSEPMAADGVIDLSGWNFRELGVVALDGQWELYPNELVGGDDRSAHGQPDQRPAGSERIAVPNAWPSVRGSVTGMATYRLGIIVDETNQVFGLKTGIIRSSNRILVNGRVVGSSGIPGDEQAHVLKVRPYVAYFTLQPGYNELLVQVANFDYSPGGGIINSLYFGHSSDIAKLKSRANAHGWIMISSFLLMGLYFSVHFMQRTKERALLTLGMVWIWLAIYSSVTGERLIYDLFPDAPHWLYIRLQFASALAACISLLFFVQQTIQKLASARFIGTMVALLAVLAILTLTGTLWEYQLLLGIYFASLLLTLLYTAYIFIYAALQRVEGSIYLAVTAFASNIYAIIQAQANYFGFPQYVLPPFEPFLVLLMLSLLMSHRTASSYRKIEELSVQLIQMDKLKDDFITRTSHEFKTPLHGIQNIAAALMDDPRHMLSPEQRDRLGLMLSITKRLSQLVYDILDMSRLKQGELTVQPVPIHVRSAVDVILHMFEYLRKGRDIAFVNHVPEQLNDVLADENRFRQIMSNLIDNALKFTERGSIEIYAREVDGQIEIAVKDSGCGIGEQEQARIFEPMVTSDSQQGESFGLGLAIVRQLVELHKGTIGLISEPGVGSTFTIRLPSANGRSEGTPQLSERPASVPAEAPYKLDTPYYSSRSGKYTILIADDHYSNLKILMDALEMLDCTVIAVKNGAEAVAQIEASRKIDIAVLDLMMPELSGIEVCRIIRKTYSALELPVLMVTAAIETRDKLAAFEAGANDYLPKPFDLSELKARILGLLAMKESLGRAVYMEMAFLQSQIKPHFLFNVLHSIIALSYKDIEKSRMLTTHLADYLRGSFQFDNTQKRVPFEAELELIRTYLDIEQVRFMNKLQVDMDIDEEIHSLSIPPLLLQPLVENAIRHGIGGKLEGGRVRLIARAEPACYRFVVEDDGIGIGREKLDRLLDDEGHATSGVGLQNINRRLKFEYGVNLQISSTADRGTTVVIEIPRSA